MPVHGGCAESASDPGNAQRRTEEGQATVELALAVPFLMMFAVLLLQLGVVAFDQIAVTHAAREAARVAAVDPDPAAVVAAARSATRLEPSRLIVSTGARPGPDGMVRVTVRYETQVRMPLTHHVLVRPSLLGDASMRVERLR